MTLPRINGNNPPPVPLNPVEPAPMEPNANGGGVPQPPVPPQPPANGGAAVAQNLLQQLDVLLVQANERKNASVEVQVLKADLLEAQVSQAKREEIEAAALKAETAFKTINQFSGEDLANAVLMEMGTDGTGGKFVWAADSKVGKAVQTAMVAQADLAGLLRSLAAQLPRGVIAHRLEDAAFRCDMRASELSLLMIKFANLKGAAVAGGAAQDPQVQAKFSQRVEELLPQQEIKMHGNAGLPSTMVYAIAPLVDRLKYMADHPDEPVTHEEFEAIQQQVNLLHNALDFVAKVERKSGVASGWLGTAVESNARELLGNVRSQLSNVRKSVGRASMRRFAKRVLAPPHATGILQPQFRALLKLVAPQLADALELRERLDGAAEKFIDEASNERAAQLRQAAAECAQIDRGAVLHELKTLAEGADIFYLDDDLAGLRAELETLPAKQRAAISDELLAEFGKALEELVASYEDHAAGNGEYVRLHGEVVECNRLVSQAEQLITMQKSIDRLDEEQLLTAGSLRAVFEGKMQVTTLVEARVNGMDDADINPALDDSRMVSSKPLGQGGVNTVQAVTYNDGSTWVFKPEAEGRKGFANAFLTHEGYQPSQQVSQLNMAVQKTADALGLGDVMVKTSVGAHQGKYGMFMEAAPGKLGGEFAQGAAGEGGLTCAQIRQLPDEQYAVVAGQLMRQSNRLAWFDLITGQGDRHNANYMVQVKPDLGVSFKGIDNDASFPSYRTGLHTFQLTGVHARRFEENLKVAEEFYPEPARNAQRQRLRNDPGVTKNADGSYTVDVSKFKALELNHVLQYTVGQRTTLAVPNAIDRDLYDHLQALKGGEARSQYLDELRKRLPENAVQAAIRRLDEAIAHADRLASEDKVYGAKDWEKREVQRSVAASASQPVAKLERVDGRSMGRGGRQAVAKTLRDFKFDVFTRDLMKAIAKPGWFE